MVLVRIYHYLEARQKVRSGSASHLNCLTIRVAIHLELPRHIRNTVVGSSVRVEIGKLSGKIPCWQCHFHSNLCVPHPTKKLNNFAKKSSLLQIWQPHLTIRRTFEGDGFFCGRTVSFMKFWYSDAWALCSLNEVYVLLLGSSDGTQDSMSVQRKHVAPPPVQKALF